MAPVIAPAPTRPRKNVALATLDPSDDDEMPDAPLPKDQDEEELEKLVFGDLAGFHEGLRADIGGEDSEDDDDEGGKHARRNQLDVMPNGTDFEAMADDQLFAVDLGDSALAQKPSEPEDEETALTTEEGPTYAPAWEDSDDERIVVSLASQRNTRKLRDSEKDNVVTGKEYARRLRRQFERIYPVPEWALPSKPTKRRRRSSASSSSGSEVEVDSSATLSTLPLESLLKSSISYVVHDRKSRLRPENLNIARLTDANDLATSFSGIQSLQFHPTHPLLLTAGLDSTIRLYHIDGKTNPPATSLHVRGSPLYTALFHPDGSRVFAGGRRRYFHVWSLESGGVERVTRVYGHQDSQKSMEKFSLSPDGQHMALVGSRGTVQILDANTSQWVSSAQVEGLVADISWHPDSSTLSIANTSGEVYEYSVKSSSFTSVWNDEGGVSTTVITNSPNNRWVAIGSASGIVNLYDRRLCFGGSGPGAMGTLKHPKPLRVFENLVTSINVIAFGPDSQIMAIASGHKKDALRMVHLPSATVFKNWPTGSTPLGRVSGVAFAPGRETGFVAVGNEQGRVRLFDIR